MTLTIKRNELFNLSQFMWDNFDEEKIPQKVTPMIGKEYGEAMASLTIPLGGGVYIDLNLYKTHSSFYGDIYILTEYGDKRAGTYILPTDIIDIEVKD